MDFKLVDLSSSITENQTLVINHGFSNEAVARATITSDLTLFMCSFEVGGSLQTFFDMRQNGGSGIVSMKNTNYAQCMGAFGLSSKIAYYLLFLPTQKYRLL